MRKIIYFILVISAVLVVSRFKKAEDMIESTVVSIADSELSAGDVEQSLSVKVSKSIEDTAEEFLADGRIQLKSSDLEFIQEHGDQIVGIRFRNVSVPQGAEIVESYIQFTVDEPASEPTYLTICGELSTDSKPFQNVNYDISGRKQTVSKIDWLPKPWLKKGDRGEAQCTSDLSLILSEIVSQEGWEKGNAISFIVNGTGKRVACSAKRRDGVDSPVLYIRFIIQN